MENIYAVKTAGELAKYQGFAAQVQSRLLAYADFLEREYGVCDLPKAIVWTSHAIASGSISNIPVPAYTNDFRIVFTPDPDTWKSIYLAQLSSIRQHEKYSELHGYYSHEISENHILQILGHELAHHIPLFADEFDTESDGGIWFEEGMVEYISRQYFLTVEEFAREHEINAILVDALRQQYGTHSLEEFGAATYAGDFASIFYAYWRSYLAVHQIVEAHQGNIHAVFASYRRWCSSRNETSLSDWFHINI